MKMDHHEHMTIAKKIAALDIGHAKRAEAFAKLATLIADLDGIDAFATLLHARTMVEPRKDSRAAEWLKEAMLRTRYGAPIG
jgi:hypothetical protein